MTSSSEYTPLPRNYLRYAIGAFGVFGMLTLTLLLGKQDRLVASTQGLKADFLDAVRENGTAAHVVQSAWSHWLPMCAFLVYVSLHGSAQLVYAVSWVYVATTGILNGVLRQHYMVNSMCFLCICCCC